MFNSVLRLTPKNIRHYWSFVKTISLLVNYPESANNEESMSILRNHDFIDSYIFKWTKIVYFHSNSAQTVVNCNMNTWLHTWLQDDLSRMLICLEDGCPKTLNNPSLIPQTFSCSWHNTQKVPPNGKFSGKTLLSWTRFAGVCRIIS